MKIKLLLTLAAIQCVAETTTVLGQVTLSTSYTSGFLHNGLVPDDTATGWSDTRTIGISGNGPITDINVSLNISGGANSDLYGYLSGPNGGFSILLNQVGKTSGDSIGYLNTGFNVTFDGSAAHDIHQYQTIPGYSINSSGQLTGIWQPDGRNVGPSPNYSVDNSTLRSEMLNSFDNKNPNGTWTLFIADLSSGGQSTVVSWGMQITAVPEPQEYAALTALALVGFALVNRRRGPQTNFCRLSR